MTTPGTLTELFFGAMDRLRDSPVVMRTRGDTGWSPVSSVELHDRVRDLSLGLVELGVTPGARVGLLSENRPEWAYVDYACLAARAVDVPVYPTLPPNQVEFILRDAGASVVFVSTAEQLAKVLGCRDRLPDLRQVVTFDAGRSGDGVLSLEDVMARGRAHAGRAAAWREEALRASPEDLATLIYTSGTTGEPKGVMLTHGNITSNVVAALTMLGVHDRDECLSFLPLSHIFERMAGHYVMLHAGVVINYARSIETVAADMADARPTVMLAVPRLYEKFYARVVEAVSRSAVKQRLFGWARRVGEQWVDLRLAGSPVPVALAVQQRLADRLVFRKLRRGAGGRLRFFVSGGAPLNHEIARFFFAAGMPILEGYGLTETSPVITVNTLAQPRLGSVGRPVPGVEVHIAEDGEILTRGPHVMKGYYKRPDATAEVIDADGWFHTGDVGRLDEDGFLSITDRKKDMIVTAGGKNIAPQPIENGLKANAFIANAVMLGDRRPFPIVLLVPDFGQLRAWAEAEGRPEPDDAALAAREDAQAKLILEAKKHFRDLAQYEVPKKFVILPRDFSIERGEMTPKMSIRRKIVAEHFQEEIERIYREA